MENKKVTVFFGAIGCLLIAVIIALCAIIYLTIDKTESVAKQPNMQVSVNMPSGNATNSTEKKDNANENKVKATKNKEEGSYQTEMLKGIISDRDGYTNVRYEPSVKSAIVARLIDGESIYIEKLYNSNWYAVYDLDKIFLGYVHKSRVRLIRR